VASPITVATPCWLNFGQNPRLVPAQHSASAMAAATPIAIPDSPYPFSGLPQTTIKFSSASPQTAPKRCARLLNCSAFSGRFLSRPTKILNTVSPYRFRKISVAVVINIKLRTTTIYTVLRADMPAETLIMLQIKITGILFFCWQCTGKSHNNIHRMPQKSNFVLSPHFLLHRIKLAAINDNCIRYYLNEFGYHNLIRHDHLLQCILSAIYPETASQGWLHQNGSAPMIV
jgi:hypothetical protein